MKTTHLCKLFNENGHLCCQQFEGMSAKSHYKSSHYVDLVPKLSQNGPKVFQDCPKVVPKLPLMSQQEHIVLERSAILTPDPKIYRRNVLKAKMMFVGGNKKSAENRRSPDNRLQ